MVSHRVPGTARRTLLGSLIAALFALSSSASLAQGEVDPAGDDAAALLDGNPNCGLALHPDASEYPYLPELLELSLDRATFGLLPTDPAAQDAVWACWHALAPIGITTKPRPDTGSGLEIDVATSAWNDAFVGADPFAIEVAARAWGLDPFALALAANTPYGGDSTYGDIYAREGIKADIRGPFCMSKPFAKDFGLRVSTKSRKADDRDDVRLTVGPAASRIRYRLDQGRTFAAGLASICREGVPDTRIMGWEPTEFFEGAVDAGFSLSHAVLIDYAIRTLRELGHPPFVQGQ
jgi:hypothetical protein